MELTVTIWLILCMHVLCIAYQIHTSHECMPGNRIRVASILSPHWLSFFSSSSSSPSLLRVSFSMAGTHAAFKMCALASLFPTPSKQNTRIVHVSAAYHIGGYHPNYIIIIAAPTERHWFHRSVRTVDHHSLTENRQVCIDRSKLLPSFWTVSRIDRNIKYQACFLKLFATDISFWNTLIRCFEILCNRNRTHS